MEPQDLPRQARLDVSSALEPMAYAAPDTLLANVLARVERLDEHLSTRQPTTELLEAVRDSQWEVRAIAIQALGEHEDAPLDQLVLALRDDHEMVRVAAVRALGRLGERAPLDQLVLALRDPDWEVREAVALTLGELETEAARPLLTAALQDSHSAVRLAAEESLARHDAASSATSARRRWAGVLVPQKLHALQSLASHYWQVLARQPAILQRNWLIPALLLFLSDSLALFITMRFMRSMQDTATTLTLVTTLAAAVGIAFAANMAHDASAELALSTATSLRVILFCRFLVVIGSTALVSGCASIALAVFYGQGVWGVVQLWLGPMLLAASLTLALVLLIGSWIAVLGAFFLEALQTLRIGAGGQLLPIGHPALWQTTPLILLLTALCLVFAFFYAPRQSRLRQSIGD